MMENFKALESELLAHRIVFAALGEVLPDLGQALESARNAPGPQVALTERYRADLEKLLRLVDQCHSDQEFAALLESWHPQGKPN